MISQSAIPSIKDKSFMRITVEITDKQTEQLKELLEDFRSGYIANPSKRADTKRLTYERCLESIVEQINDTVEGCKPTVERIKIKPEKTYKIP